ncbi:pyridoxamine 5'-phosphate oxidase family protein [Pararhodospirillum oryzae]|uniref:Flavin-nucleotide-binding protein n=1 Tax=Pararhodospirillum oryzae TaxID=478448 RepID=A0A512H413_9PROT|nr:pyridoxamine 5'-phosphate oxidase family protein [Pararhodospirillum oryzae]GEO80209.1 hypothetical protein ROR02_03400 [Pararhodospirillum oryzae]
MPSSVPSSPRTRLVRRPERANHDPAALRAVLDSQFVCHLAWQSEAGPVCVPTCYGRLDETLYLHGAPASRLMAAVRQGPVPVCLTVSVIDGIVFAPRACGHSLNFRSVMVMGNATLVTDPEEITRALAALTDQVTPGRLAECRPMTPADARGVAVLALSLAEASMKQRQGGPSQTDDPDQPTDFPAWSGVVPLSVVAGTPEPAGPPRPEPPSLARLAARYPRP